MVDTEKEIAYSTFEESIYSVSTVLSQNYYDLRPKSCVKKITRKENKSKAPDKI